MNSFFIYFAWVYGAIAVLWGLFSVWFCWALFPWGGSRNWLTLILVFIKSVIFTPWYMRQAWVNRPKHQ